MSKAKSKNGLGMCNPVIRKMAMKVDEYKEEEKSSQVATYNGIMNKSLYFMLVCVVGIIGFILLNNVFLNNAHKIGGVISVVDEQGIYKIETCLPELIAIAVAVVVVLFAPLMAWILRKTIPVVGTIYALCEGYFIGMIASFLMPEYKWISIAAFVLTAALVSVMLMLYIKRIVKVSQKFKTVISALFFTMIFGGLIIFVLTITPITRPMVIGITTFMNNPIIGIVSSIVFIIIAALFLLVDFDTIEQCVKKEMPKSMEWMAAFGLVYTIIYIYFKILNLLLQITENSKN